MSTSTTEERIALMTSDLATARFRRRLERLPVLRDPRSWLLVESSLGGRVEARQTFACLVSESELDPAAKAWLEAVRDTMPETKQAEWAAELLQRLGGES